MFSNLINSIAIHSLNLLAQADNAPESTDPPAAAPAGAGMFGEMLTNPLVPMVGLFLLFYFIFILPERRRKADEAKMMSAVKKNDRIITVGGIHATIVAAPADSDVVTIKIDEGGNTRVKLNRSAISKVVRDGDGKSKESDSGTKN